MKMSHEIVRSPWPFVISDSKIQISISVFQAKCLVLEFTSEAPARTKRFLRKQPGFNIMSSCCLAFLSVQSHSTWCVFHAKFEKKPGVRCFQAEKSARVRHQGIWIRIQYSILHLRVFSFLETTLQSRGACCFESRTSSGKEASDRWFFFQKEDLHLHLSKGTFHSQSRSSFFFSNRRPFFRHTSLTRTESTPFNECTLFFMYILKRTVEMQEHANSVKKSVSGLRELGRSSPEERPVFASCFSKDSFIFVYIWWTARVCSKFEMTTRGYSLKITEHVMHPASLFFAKLSEHQRSVTVFSCCSRWSLVFWSLFIDWTRRLKEVTCHLTNEPTTVISEFSTRNFSREDTNLFAEESSETVCRFLAWKVAGFFFFITNFLTKSVIIRLGSCLVGFASRVPTTQCK